MNGVGKGKSCRGAGGLFFCFYLWRKCLEDVIWSWGAYGLRLRFTIMGLDGGFIAGCWENIVLDAIEDKDWRVRFMGCKPEGKVTKSCRMCCRVLARYWEHSRASQILKLNFAFPFFSYFKQLLSHSNFYIT